MITKKISSFFTPFLLLLILFFLTPNQVEARKLYYLEEFYRLYYLPLKFDNQDLARNIHWLQFATNRPFAPPIHALLVHDDETTYKKYQILLKMHLHYLLTKNFVYLAARFDKHKPVFFNKPYAKDILASLKIAEYLYREAIREWKIVINDYYSQVKDISEYKRVRTRISFLDELITRITTGELDYQRVIERRLKKISEAKEYFSQP